MNQFIPAADESLNKNVCSISVWSDIVSWSKHTLVFIYFKKNNPASIIVLLLYVYPKWGLDNDKYVNIFDENSYNLSVHSIINNMIF